MAKVPNINTVIDAVVEFLSNTSDLSEENRAKAFDKLGELVDTNDEQGIRDLAAKLNVVDGYITEAPVTEHKAVMARKEKNMKIAKTQNQKNIEASLKAQAESNMYKAYGKKIMETPSGNKTAMGKRLIKEELARLDAARKAGLLFPDYGTADHFTPDIEESHKSFKQKQADIIANTDMKTPDVVMPTIRANASEGEHTLRLIRINMDACTPKAATWKSFGWATLIWEDVKDKSVYRSKMYMFAPKPDQVNDEGEPLPNWTKIRSCARVLADICGFSYEDVGNRVAGEPNPMAFNHIDLKGATLKERFDDLKNHDVSVQVAHPEYDQNKLVVYFKQMVTNTDASSEEAFDPWGAAENASLDERYKLGAKGDKGYEESPVEEELGYC